MAARRRGVAGRDGRGIGGCGKPLVSARGKALPSIARGVVLRLGDASIARRARGTPRVANRLLRRVRDFATVRGRGAAENPDHHKDHAPLVGRRGKPEEVAKLVRYLAGPDARYMTGQTLHANGGVFMP